MRKYSRISVIEKQLTGISKKVQIKYFPELLALPVKINTRMKVLAKIAIPGIYADPKIEINIKHYQKGTLPEIKDTLKHEYIHYQLHHEGKPYYHNIQFAKMVHKMNLRECFQFDAKYIEKCKCGYAHWANKRKEMNNECPYCGKTTRIRKRF